VGVDRMDSTPLDKGSQFSLGQRFGIGVNVAVTIIAATALLVLVNWIATVKSTHRDWSSLGRYSLSQRTRHIVEEVKSPITLTVLYTSEDPKKQRDESSGVEYKGRLMELLADIRGVGQEVKVADVVSADQREELAARLEKDLARQASGYRELIDAFGKNQDRWIADLNDEFRRLTAMADEGWAGRFIQIKAGCEMMRRSAALVEDTAKELRKPAGGRLTAYDKKAETLQKALAQLVESVDTVQKSIRQMDELTKKVAGDDGGVEANSAKLKTQIEAEFKAVSAKLDAAAKGKAAATSQPGAQRGEEIVKAVDRLRDLLIQQSRLLEQFGKDQPALYTYAGWIVEFQDQGIELPDMFQLPSRDLAQVANVVSHAESAESLVDIAGPLKKGVDDLKDFTVQKSYGDLARMLAAIKQVDPAGQKLLADVAANKFLNKNKTADQIREMLERFKKLPPLATRGLADKFKQDNVVLVEVGKTAPQLLTFDEVWPQTVAPMQSNKDDKIPLKRTFNGDAAIGSALLSATRDKLAELVFVTCVAKMPPAANPYQPAPRPDEGGVPYTQLNTLRQRLEKVGFKVTSWNLTETLTPPEPAYGGEKAAAASQPDSSKKPLPRVYVVLPPPAAEAFDAPDKEPGESPNPNEPPEDPRVAKFGAKERKAIGDVLRAGGRAIFLAGLTVKPVMNPMNGEPIRDPETGEVQWQSIKYKWNRYLEDEWGLKVLTNMLIYQGIPTPHEGRWRVNVIRLWRMLLNQYNPDHPVGKPLANQWLLAADACPIKVEKQRKGVTCTTVLEIPANDRRYWASGRSINDARREALDQKSLTLQKGDLLPPLAAMIDARRLDDKGGDRGEIIVFSAGNSFRDGFLEGEGIRFDEEGALEKEAAPDMNPEILIDAAFYLAGEKDLIATGTTSVPPINVPPGRMVMVYGVVAALPLAVLVFGGMVILARRRKR
jgi:hypothetical protein